MYTHFVINKKQTKKIRLQHSLVLYNLKVFSQNIERQLNLKLNLGGAGNIKKVTGVYILFKGMEVAKRC